MSQKWLKEIPINIVTAQFRHHVDLTLTDDEVAQNIFDYFVDNHYKK